MEYVGNGLHARYQNKMSPGCLESLLTKTKRTPLLASTPNPDQPPNNAWKDQVCVIRERRLFLPSVDPGRKVQPHLADCVGEPNAGQEEVGGSGSVPRVWWSVRHMSPCSNLGFSIKSRPALDQELDS